MKIPVIFFLILLIFSCQEKEGFVSEINFSYTLDTIMVNSKGLLLNVQSGISNMTTSPSGQTLYFYNSSEKRLDLIDLNTYDINQSLYFSSEGPNGIGNLSPFDIDISENGEITIAYFDAIRKMDSLGARVKTFSWEGLEYNSGKIPEGNILSFSGEYNGKGETFFGIYGKLRGGNSSGNGLAILNISELSIRTMEIPLLKTLEDYKIVLNGELPMTNGDHYFLKLIYDKVLISTETENSIAIYEIQKDSLYQLNFHSQLLPDKKPGNYEKRVNTIEEMEMAMKSKVREITFGRFIWDSKGKKYFRFSQVQKSFDPVQFQVYLSVFDEDFNLIFEKDNLPRLTGNTFFYNGYLHKVINLNDELAFLRFKPSFDNN